MEIEWKNKKETFEEVDARKLTGNFLPMVLSKAGKKAVGDGLCVIQSFEPIPTLRRLSNNQKT